MSNWTHGFAATAQDPNGKNQHEAGAKLDSGKVLAGVLSDFGYALQAVAEVGSYGARKYTRHGWEEVPDGGQRYFDAKWRHLLSRHESEFDIESGLRHLAHEAWNTLAELELIFRIQSHREDK